MFDHLLGLILLGLGISSPMTPPVVKGESTQQQEISGSSGGGGSDDSGSGSTSGKDATGTSGVTSQSETETHAETEDSGQRLPTGLIGIPAAERKRAEDGEEIEFTGLHGKKFTLRGELEFDVEKRREEASGSMRKKMQAFTMKLQTIKNIKKQETVSEIQSHINELNAKRTDKMTEQLNKMTAITGRIASMGAALKSKGTDITTLDSAITAAGGAIISAQDSVVTQAGKSYVVTITSEKNLKTDVGTVLKLLQSDLKTVNAAVVETRKSISNAIRVLAQLKGEKPPDAVLR